MIKKLLLLITLLLVYRCNGMAEIELNELVPLGQNLPNITLELSNKSLNDITNGKIKEIAPNINYYALARINVSHNRLQVLPLGIITISCPHLEEVIASHNSITCIDLTHNTTDQQNDTPSRLATLDIHRNECSEINIEGLFGKYPLTLLNISHNKLKNIQTEDMHTPKGIPFLSESYPLINVSRNDNLEQEQKNILLAWYLTKAQANIHNNTLAKTGLTSITSCAITAMLMLQLRDENTFAWQGITALTGFFVLGAGILSYPIFKYLSRDKLKEKEETTNNNIIF